jgi:hypothetical protein
MGVMNAPARENPGRQNHPRPGLLFGRPELATAAHKPLTGPQASGGGRKRSPLAFRVASSLWWRRPKWKQPAQSAASSSRRTRWKLGGWAYAWAVGLVTQGSKRTDQYFASGI